MSGKVVPILDIEAPPHIADTLRDLRHAALVNTFRTRQARYWLRAQDGVPLFTRLTVRMECEESFILTFDIGPRVNHWIYAILPRQGSVIRVVHGDFAKRRVTRVPGL